MGFTALKESFLPFLGSVLPQYVVLCVYAGSANFSAKSCDVAMTFYDFGGLILMTPIVCCRNSTPF